MTSHLKEERLREIERAQEALRVSIDDTRRLAEKVQEMLERRQPRAAEEQPPPPRSG